MPAPERIRQLIETFEQNLPAYRAGKNETELRRQFLDPFFEALGWDVDNRKGYDERRKEVEHEHSVEIDGQQKKADYAFRTGRDDFDFLVEAKKPSVKIESSLEAAFQLRRYGWSAGLPINILTDFEHFAVYDCRQKPNLSKDKAATGRLMLLHYKEYAEKWDELAALFSPEAIRRGALDRWKDDARGKKGTQEVDEAFLEEIEAWREALARNIALRNKPLNLNEDQINFAVQMTIDRIIFLRIAEERGMEKERRLWEAAFSPANVGQPVGQVSDLPTRSGDARHGSVYANLLKLFAQADSRYNSGLFHFKKEKGREAPDDLTPRLTVDDKVLKDIIKGLYYPSPYSFSYIPAEILGSVYERFLGKVIRLTAGGNAKVEEKPEVRKAGGVYYTPSYIVDYIVKNTVGELVNGNLGRGMTPEDVAQLKIVDPACGSGSFLLGAFRYLLDWHLNWYAAHAPEKYVKSGVLLTADGKTYRLSLEEKKRILLNNIYGLDLDPQAVEVTKLSLLLKVVEDPGQLKLFEEGRILPNLDKNIKNGNALIGPDYFDGQLMPDLAELKRVKPFDWRAEFPQVFARGGFDVVIGNPPYVHSRSDQFADREKKYYFSHSRVAEYQINSFVLFVEKSFELLKNSGRVGVIIPNYWLATQFDRKFRHYLFYENNIDELVNVYQVFLDATVDTLILIGHRTPSPSYPKQTVLKSISRECKSISERLESIRSNSWSYSKTITIPVDAPDIELKMEKGINLKSDARLGDYFDMRFGMKPYQVGKGNPPQTQKIVDGKIFDAKEKKDETYFPLLKARNVKRYNLNWQGDWIKYGLHLAEPRNLSLFTGVRILIQRIVSGASLDGVLEKDTYICNTDVITLQPKSNLDYRQVLFYLGIILSRPIAIYLKSQNINLDRVTFPKINTQTMLSLPVPSVVDNVNQAQHDKMVTLVEQMLALHKALSAAPGPQERGLLERQIAATDRQIDALVYQLYGLTEEEIRIVEGNQA